MEDEISYEKAFTLINSWTMRENESYALWKIYLGNNEYGVAIKSTVGRLLDSLKNDKYDIKVTEISYNPNRYTDTIEKIVSTKNNYYDYENELRAVIFDQFKKSRCKKRIPKHDHGTGVKVDLLKLITEVRVSPMAPDYFLNLVKNITKLIQVTHKERDIPVYSSKIIDTSF